MGMTRQERIASHKKQDRLLTKEGIPTLDELKEGVSVLRTTDEGLVEYLKQDKLLYKSIWAKAKVEDPAGGRIPKLTNPGYVVFDDTGLIIQWGQTDSTGTPVTVTFTLPFPAACFVVCSNSMVETSVGSSNYNIAVQTYDYTKTNFKARVIGGSGTDYGGTNDGFAWIAIGN